MGKIKDILGPGLLMAAAAIGVSHLVQSTRAGADFGLQLIPLILLVNLFKYPFFEYGHRFYAVTGKNLLQGYQDLGKGYLTVFLLLNLFTAIASVAAVTFVTSALCQNLLGLSLNLTLCSALLLGVSLLLLALGQYRGLDIFIKVLMVVLLITTLLSLGISFTQQGNWEMATSTGESPYQWLHLGFLLALMGWMPAPIELSVWQSLWLEAAEEGQGKKLSLQEALLDFNFGYILTVLLAVAFCSLGALVMFGRGESFSGSAVVFAKQVVDLYTQNLGEWSRPVIAMAAFVTMFSTTITLTDAYPRSLAVGTRILFNKNLSSKLWLQSWIAVICFFALLVIWFFRDQLKAMVDIVTIIAFLAGPIFGFINLRLITSHQVEKKFQPGAVLLVLSWFGLLSMTLLSLLFISQKF